MTRLELENELRKRGLIWKADEIDIVMKGIEYDNCQSLQFVTKDFIVCRFDSAVMDSEFRIYDKNYNLVGVQNVWKDAMFGWESYCCFE